MPKLRWKDVMAASIMQEHGRSVRSLARDLGVAESFYTEQGQQVLHRRFVGPEARISQNYSFDKLREEESTTFRGTEYRLWYDTLIR